MTKKKTELTTKPIVESKIFMIRGKQVMLDKDLAELYEVETKVLNQAVKRNLKRFPRDFMFQLKDNEIQHSRSQIVTLNSGRGRNTKYLPYAFTENGIAMLSSVLNSERAIMVNIQIMRTFTRLREILSTSQEIKKKIDEHDQKLIQISEVLKRIITQITDQPVKPKPQIGFRGKRDEG
ncbi:MAG: ORF6N domain-containing protein [Candidatus Wallbacteria bacterium]|nr:ORF6N domain-containing protein [Candidatus Wallbacteria bacterium]